MSADLADPIEFLRGPSWRGRVALAPLTNMQSHDDGSLGDDEVAFLARRTQGGLAQGGFALGGFALVVTCAAHVTTNGQAFRGQSGAWSDPRVPGLTRLATAIRADDSASAVQLQHTRDRADRALTGGDLLSASANPKRGSRTMTTGELERTIQDFVDTAVLCEKAGFDGVELHGAHG